MRRWLSVLALLLPLTLLGQSRPEQQTPTDKKGNETENRPTPVVAQPTAQQQQGKSDRSCKIPMWTDPFWPNWALVGVGIAAAWIAVGTLNDLKEQTAAAKTSADTAKTSAETAQQSAEFTRKTIENSERAQVLIDHTAIAFYRTGQFDNHSWLEITIKNFGRTRARDVIGSFMIFVGEVKHSGPVISHLVLGAGQEHVVACDRFSKLLNTQQWGAALRGETLVRFSGSLTYQDIFGGTVASDFAGRFNHNTIAFDIEVNETG
jgi:hypothetical protein